VEAIQPAYRRLGGPNKEPVCALNNAYFTIVKLELEYEKDVCMT
jgi:hypothetical protein